MCKNCSCKDNGELKRLLKVRDAVQVLVDLRYGISGGDITLDRELDLVNSQIEKLVQ